MRYIAAWILGVPFSLIVIWFVVAHSACAH
jgi:hypothetical protein